MSRSCHSAANPTDWKNGDSRMLSIREGEKRGICFFRLFPFPVLICCYQLAISFWECGSWRHGDREMSGAEDPEMWFLVWAVRPLRSLLSDCLV